LVIHIKGGFQNETNKNEKKKRSDGHAKGDEEKEKSREKAATTV
jgi:hypothetical protein